ncbi:MAG: DUF3010 family protein [Sinobacterium sp.]|nr:DUF3010 family protein [Sinobacterium sp.]
MLVCGVELKGKEAILTLLSLDKGVFMVPDCRQRAFTVSPSYTAQTMKEFSFAFQKLVEDYKIEEIAILGRDQKGKFMGSATSFKLEAVLQLLDCPVTVMSSADIKAQIKRNPVLVEFDSLGLKTFQKPAFNVAFAYHNFLQYGEQSSE